MTDITLEVSDLSRRWSLGGQRYTAAGELIQPPRTPGVHLSGVLYRVAVSIGVLRPGEPIEEDLPTICAMGFMWEEFAASLYRGMDYQPGETCLDGVYMTCDGINLLTAERGEEELVVEEFKFTQKKLLEPEDFLGGDKAWYYRAQGQGYCAGYGAELVRWHVMFVRGDYRALGPVYRRYLVRFSEKEIKENWEMVKRNKAGARAEGL